MSGTMSNGQDDKTPATLPMEPEEYKMDLADTPPEELRRTPEVPKSEEAGEVTQDRDPGHMNDHVKIRFDELFAEPDPEIYSFDKVWSLTDKLFTNTKIWCYRITSILCAIPLAICWGCYFACIAFCTVWCCVPCLKSEQMECFCIRKMWELLLQSVVAPCFEAIGRCCGGIRVKLSKE